MGRALVDPRGQRTRQRRDQADGRIRLQALPDLRRPGLRLTQRAIEERNGTCVLRADPKAMNPLERHIVEGRHTGIVCRDGKVELPAQSAIEALEIDCGEFVKPLEPLVEACRRIAERLGAGSSPPPPLTVVDRRREALGDVEDRAIARDFVNDLRLLASRAVFPVAVVFHRVDAADSATVERISQLVDRETLRVPLVLGFSSDAPPATAGALLARLNARGDVIRASAAIRSRYA